MRPAAPALDGVALGLSGLCLAHCLVLPLLAAALPLFGAWAQAEWAHVLFVLAAAPLAGTALVRPGHGLKPSSWLIGLGLAGLGLLAVGAFGPAAHEQAATIGGSLLLAGAHLLNWRRRAACAGAEPSCAPN